LIGLLNPVTGVLLGILVSGDVLNLRQVGGLALVLLGITLSQVRVNPPASFGRMRQLDVTE
jgi:probable blue pigment (indigoidine) exporter